VANESNSDTMEQPGAGGECAGQKVVLCVDDDPGILGALLRVLRRTGCEVLTASGAAEALRAAAERRPDLILLDMTMPEMDGMELLGRLRKILNDVTVVFVTGRDCPDLAAGRHPSGVHYIRKPFQNQELRNLVETLTGVRKEGH